MKYQKQIKALHKIADGIITRKLIENHFKRCLEEYLGVWIDIPSNYPNTYQYTTTKKSLEELEHDLLEEIEFTKIEWTMLDMKA